VPDFNPATYGPVFLPLLTIDRNRELGPGRPSRNARAALDALSVESAFAGQSVVDPQMALLCIGGLWLLHDFLDESHRISQSIETTSGSYWHGIMHRREPDYSNAKYWFRRVGTHPIYGRLCEDARELARSTDDPATAYLIGQTNWDSFHFVELCEQAAARRQIESVCRAIQQCEWELLFDHCYRNAISA
jgi:hypothetical protein